jgi:hypothetical protein
MQRFANQGGQIGRNFDYWANVNFGQFLIITKVASNYGLGTFSTVKVMYSIWEKMDWAIFWATF